MQGYGLMDEEIGSPQVIRAFAGVSGPECSPPKPLNSNSILGRLAILEEKIGFLQQEVSGLAAQLANLDNRFSNLENLVRG